MIKQIPNILTLGRFVLTVIFLVMLLYSPQISDDNYSFYIDIAFALFIIAGLTDMIDGTVARALKVTSKFGRIMDPLADKVLVCGAVICFAILGRPTLFGWSKSTLAIIHWGYAAILILREVYVTVLRQMAEAKGINFAATFSGKIKMFLQSFAIGTVMVKMAHVHEAQWGWWFTSIVYILTVAVTVVSGLRATQRKSWKETQNT
jgi:CDP-diacylglycerol--glycerol-3-phosphate 3-phosphatidyltransferase